MQLHRAIFSIQTSLLAIACGCLACLTLVASPVSAQQHPGVKCIVDGDLQCNVRYSIEFGQGEIYFGSRSAVENFRSNVLEKAEQGLQPEPSLVLKANHQLALTNQVQQQRCPVSGKAINKEHKLLIAGVNVFFHDNVAKEKVQAADSTWHRARLVFAKKAFAKSFIATVKPFSEPTVIVADGSHKSQSKQDAKANSLITR